MATVTLKLEELPSFVGNVAKEANFAAVVALTRTAQSAQQAVKDRMAAEFILRNRYTQRQVRMKPATKRDPVAAVYLTPEADYMIIHETGGTKRPRGNHIAVPTDEVWPNRRRVLPLGKRPRELAKKSTKRKPFLMIPKSGARLIVQRVGKERLPVRVLYSLSRNPEVRKRLQFIETVTENFRGRFSQEFVTAFEEGLKKAARDAKAQEWPAK